MVNAVQVENQEKDTKNDSVKGISFWSSRTKGERCLTLALTTVLFVAVILAFSLASFITKSKNNNEVSDANLPSALGLVQSPKTAKPSNRGTMVTNQKKSSQYQVCIEKGCVTAAAAMIERMDETVDPCEDFFDFSCGKFVKETIIPDEKSSVSMFSEVSDKLRNKMRTLVQEEIVETDPPATVMAKNLFKSCMNIESIEQMGLEPLHKILKEMGGWPVVDGDAWNETAFDWMQSLFTNRKLGFSVDYLFDFSVTADVRNSSWRMIWIDQPGLGMSREYLMKGLNDSDVQAYLQYSVDVAKLLGAEPTRAEKEMIDVLKFQMEIANISLPREQRRNMTKLYNVMSLTELQSKVQSIPWMKYMNTVLTKKVQVTENERIGVSDITYFTNFTKIMEKTPKRTVANYLMWRVVAAAASYLSDNIRDLQLEYSKKLTGKATRPPRWKECMGLVSGKLAYAMGNLYVKKFFDNDAKSQADSLVTYVRQEFDTILNSIDWMDEATRSKALEKAEAIKAHIAYPKELLVDENLTKHYGNLTIHDKVLLDNMRTMGIFGTDYAFNRLREIVDKLDWKRQAAVAVVNAYYSSIENSIKFPAGILQGVFFEPDRPKYMNFGAVGFVIGHEITHGFDDQGKQFDSVGNLKNWWDSTTEKKFLDKAKCIIYQYGNYTAPENNMKLNGVNTQGENIADNGGIKEAYNAYQKWVKDHGEEQILPGLDYTPNQLFWLSAAQVWCSKYRPQSLKIRILTGVHSPGRFRVKGSFSNSEQFASDWNCPAGSPMNPKKKCSVW